MCLALYFIAELFLDLLEHRVSCLTLLEILEIYWNYFSSWKSWKSSGNLQNLLEIFRLSLCVCCYYDSQFLYFKMYQ